MLIPLLGRAGSGKTTYIYDKIRRLTDSGESVMLIVPEQYTFESEKAMIELLGVRRADSVKVRSFSSLSLAVTEKHRGVKRQSVNSASKCVIMSMALESVADEISIFSHCMKSKSSVRQLLNLSDELVRGNENGESLLLAAAKTGNALLLEKARELSLICQAYDALLADAFTDDRYLINEAARLAAEHKEFERINVFFDDFTGFTAQEELLVEQLLLQAKSVTASFCATGLTDASMGTGAFSYPTENLRRLISLAKRLNVSVAEPVILTERVKTVTGALAAVEASIYEPLFEPFGEETGDITVAVAANPFEECDFVALTAKRLVREKGLRFRDMVVIGNGEAYKKYLPFAFKKYGVPVFEDTRRALENELICVFALCALRLCVSGFATDDMLSYLKTGLAGIASQLVSELENYAYMYDLGARDWLREWTAHPDGFGFELDGDAASRLELLNSAREKAVAPLLRLRERLGGADGQGCVRALYDFLIEVGADISLKEFAMGLDDASAYECERSWDEFMDMLSLLADTLGERSVTAQRFSELFSIAVGSSDIGSLPSGLDELTFGDADRIRVGDKKTVFIIGANEGVFPQTHEASFVLTDAQRRMLSNQGLRLGDDSAAALKKERHRIYSSLAVATESLYVCYSLTNETGEQLGKSEIVRGVEAIAPRCAHLSFSSLGAVEKTQSVESAFEQAALHFNDNSPQARAVKSYARSKEQLADRLESVARALDSSPKRIEDSDAAKALFGKSMHIYSSRVEEYYKCPFKYFCRYGVGARPAARAVFDPIQNGLMVHAVLEKLFAAEGAAKIKEMTRAQRKNAVDACAESYISERLGGADSLGGRLRYSLDRCKAAILDILERLCMEIDVSEFVTRDVELSIGESGEIAPYSVELEDGSSVLVGGIVDRVDTYSSASGKSYLRVIDYKTGGKDFRLSDIISGQNLQMLIYLTCLYENSQERYGKTIPAGVLYVPAKKGRNKLGRNATEEQVRAEQLAQGRMKGIVLADEEVIRAMEADGGGLIIEAKIDKDGKIKGKTFDLNGFSLIHATVDRLIARMASGLRAGKIDIMPLAWRGGDACRYCDYSGVCAHESDGVFRQQFEGDAWSAMEELCNE